MGPFGPHSDGPLGPHICNDNLANVYHDNDHDLSDGFYDDLFSLIWSWHDVSKIYSK